VKLVIFNIWGYIQEGAFVISFNLRLAQGYNDIIPAALEEKCTDIK
jgi:hypothetical protein